MSVFLPFVVFNEHLKLLVVTMCNFVGDVPTYGVSERASKDATFLRKGLGVQRCIVWQRERERATQGGA